MKIYKDVGYDSFFIDDHVPSTFQDTPFGHRGRAFAMGYIQALIESVNKGWINDIWFFWKCCFSMCKYLHV